MINITRTQMVSLLKHYRAERESINSVFCELVKDLESFFAPSSAMNFDRVMVQRQYDVGKQVDRILSNCATARHWQREALLDLKRRTELLDRLMACVVKLPGEMRALITETVMGDIAIRQYAEQTNKSKSQIQRDQSQAIDVLYGKLTKRHVESSYANENGTNGTPCV